MILKILFIAVLYLLFGFLVYKLSQKENFQNLLKKMSTMLDENATHLWSATRFIMVMAWALIMGIWAFISLWNMKLEEMPGSVVTILVTSATLKYIQKREEKNDHNQ